MSRVVTRSINDPTGLRCLDLVQLPSGRHSWQECRRDPEDSHGWRVVGHAVGDFADADAALQDARAQVAWLREEQGA